VLARVNNDRENQKKINRTIICATFPYFLMVVFCHRFSTSFFSVALSKLGYTNLIFIEPKINLIGNTTETCCWCRDAACQWPASSQGARDTVELLCRDRPMSSFINSDTWSANSPYLYIQWITALCGAMQKPVYQVPIRDMDELRQRLVEIRAEFQQNVVDNAHWWVAKQT